MIDFSALENALGYTFRDKSLLERALTHSSYAHEHKGEDYERLEYLGDAVLDYVTALLLFEKYPDKKEGEMTKIRASLVKEETLSEVSDSLKLTDYLRLSQGTQSHPVTSSKAVKCDIFEAVIGAVLLDSDKNIPLVTGFITKFLQPYLAKDYYDYKSALLEIFAKNNVNYRFETEGEFNPKNPLYTTVLYVENKKAAVGKAKTKKGAEAEACKAYYKLFF